MFYNNDNPYRAHSRENFPRGYQYDDAQASQAKLFADAYSNQNPDKGNTISYEVRERAVYRHQLIETERRLLAEILLMAVMYQYYERLSRYYGRYGGGRMQSAPTSGDDLTAQYFGHYLKNHFGHMGSHMRHWARPRFWVHEAERTEHRLNRQWHSWNRQNHWQDWGKAGVGLANRLIADARHNIGQPVWAFTRFAGVCQSGNLGCAATVSELLQEAGVKISGSAGVYGVVDQLSAAGWQRIKISDKQQFRPGDVVFGVHGSHGHIGIISEANNGRVLVCDNSSSARTLKERTIESGGSFTPGGRFAGNLYVMRQSV